MPDAHSSIVGGSTAARRLGCPGSREMEAAYPDTGASAAAIEGTALHSAMEWLLDRDEPIHVKRLTGRAFGHPPVRVTEEHITTAIMPALAYFDEVVRTWDYEVEVQGPFPGIEGAFGTADIVAYPDPRRLIILDWKFGTGVPVSAVGNAQLRYYACVAIERLRAWSTVEEVDLHICQPRVPDGNSSERVTIDELDAFRVALRKAIDGPPTLAAGDWCRWCRARAVCPEQRARAAAAIRWTEIGRDLPAALSMISGLEDWIRSVQQAAHDALEAGADVPGYKLVEKRRTRQWISEDSALEYLVEAGVPLDEAAPRQVLSPVQAEKRLKAAGESLPSQLVTLSSPGLTIAPDTDKRPAVAGRSNATAEVDALAAFVMR
jgi:hypothetical protein